MAPSDRKLLQQAQGIPQNCNALSPQPFAGEPTVEWILNSGIVGEPERCTERLIAELDVLTPVHMSFYMGFAGVDQR